MIGCSRSPGVRTFPAPERSSVSESDENDFRLPPESVRDYYLLSRRDDPFVAATHCIRKRICLLAEDQTVSRVIRWIGISDDRMALLSLNIVLADISSGD